MAEILAWRPVIPFWGRGSFEHSNFLLHFNLDCISANHTFLAIRFVLRLDKGSYGLRPISCDI